MKSVKLVNDKGGRSEDGRARSGALSRRPKAHWQDRQVLSDQALLLRHQAKTA